MFLFAVALLAVAGASAQLTSCPEPYGLQLYEHPTSCHQFYKCANGTLTLETCENGLLFDGKGAVHNFCNYNWAVDCGAREVDLTAITTPPCVYQFGIYPVSDTGCYTSYLKCSFGVPEEALCQPGLAYDPQTHSCNWPDLLLDPPTSCNPEAIVGTSCPTGVPANSLTRRFFPFPRYSIPDNCRSFITCVNGFPRLITCGGEKPVFNAAILSCDYPENVDIKSCQ